MQPRLESCRYSGADGNRTAESVSAGERSRGQSHDCDPDPIRRSAWEATADRPGGPFVGHFYQTETMTALSNPKNSGVFVQCDEKRIASTGRSGESSRTSLGRSPPEPLR